MAPLPDKSFWPKNKLGFGLMRLPQLDENDPKSIDEPQVERMIDTFLERGMTYLDTAYMYHDFASELSTGRTLVSRYPHDRYTIATKMPTMLLKSEGDLEQIFNDQLKKLGVEYFDFYLLHSLDVSNYANANRFGTFDYLRRKKSEGKIKHLGLSFHDNAQLLDEILTANPDMEFVQLQINYLDWDNEGIQSRKCYETAVKHGKPVIVMEPIKGGTLAKLPAEAETILRELHPDWSMAMWAIKFAASLENVMVVLSGMSNYAQLDENTSSMEHFEPLNQVELDALERVKNIIQSTVSIPCTGCRYCVEGDRCAQKILIPNYFSLYNAAQIDVNKAWNPQKAYYQNFVKHGNGKASDCLKCRKCERVCPQHIKITEWLGEVAEAFE